MASYRKYKYKCFRCEIFFVRLEKYNFCMWVDEGNIHENGFDVRKYLPTEIAIYSTGVL